MFHQAMLFQHLNSSAFQVDRHPVQNNSCFSQDSEAGTCSPPGKHRSASSSTPPVAGPTWSSQHTRCHCNDSGMVLTTWVVSPAAGGELKKVLV